MEQCFCEIGGIKPIKSSDRTKPVDALWLQHEWRWGSWEPFPPTVCSSCFNPTVKNPELLIKNCWKV